MATVAVVSGIMGFNAQKHESNHSPLVIANVEALTSDEELPPTLDCYGGQIECARVSTSPGTVHIFHKN